MSHSIIHPNQTVSPGVYGRMVADLCNFPHEFLAAHSARITSAYEMGESVEMIAEEMKLRYSLRRPAAHKTPRQLAAGVVRLS